MRRNGPATSAAAPATGSTLSPRSASSPSSFSRVLLVKPRDRTTDEDGDDTADTVDGSSGSELSGRSAEGVAEQLYDLACLAGDVRCVLAQGAGSFSVHFYDVRAARRAVRVLQPVGKVRPAPASLELRGHVLDDDDAATSGGRLVVFAREKQATNSELLRLLGDFGQVREIREARGHRRAHRFVEFYDSRSAYRALQALRVLASPTASPTNSAGSAPTGSSVESDFSFVNSRRYFKVEAPRNAGRRPNTIAVYRAAMSDDEEGLVSVNPRAVQARSASSSGPSTVDTEEVFEDVAARAATAAFYARFPGVGSAPSLAGSSALAPATTGSLRVQSTSPGNVSWGTDHRHRPSSMTSASGSGWGSVGSRSTGTSHPSPHQSSQHSSSSGSFSTSPSSRRPSDSTRPAITMSDSSSSAAGSSTSSSASSSASSSSSASTSGFVWSGPTHSSGFGPYSSAASSSSSYSASASTSGTSRSSRSRNAPSHRSNRPHLPAVMSGADGRTSLMIRNIPNKYTQRMLLDLLDRYGLRGAYDFFYVPIDFQNKCLSLDTVVGLGSGCGTVRLRDWPVDAHGQVAVQSSRGGRIDPSLFSLGPATQQGFRTVVEVAVAGRVPLVCTGDHRVAARPAPHADTTWTPAQDLVPGDSLVVTSLLAPLDDEQDHNAPTGRPSHVLWAGRRVADDDGQAPLVGAVARVVAYVRAGMPKLRQAVDRDALAADVSMAADAAGHDDEAAVLAAAADVEAVLPLPWGCRVRTEYEGVLRGLGVLPSRDSGPLRYHARASADRRWARLALRDPAACRLDDWTAVQPLQSVRPLSQPQPVADLSVPLVAGDAGSSLVANGLLVHNCNVGYAFINMMNTDAVATLIRTFDGQSWERFNSDKVCAIAYARIQGKAELIRHFQKSSLLFEDAHHRPLVFVSDGPRRGEPEEFPSRSTTPH